MQNAEAHLDTIIRLLKASGVDFPGNKNMKFSGSNRCRGLAHSRRRGVVNGDKRSGGLR